MQQLKDLSGAAVVLSANDVEIPDPWADPTSRFTLRIYTTGVLAAKIGGSTFGILLWVWDVAQGHDDN